MTDPYHAGYMARKRGKPFNPRNSTEWKRGWQESHTQLREDDEYDWRLDDDWMIDREMEAKG